MYIYMLPLSPSNPSAGNDDALPPLSAAAAAAEATITTPTPTPTPDGGVEITAARFDDAAAWRALLLGALTRPSG